MGATVTLRPSSGDPIVIEKALARHSGFLDDMLEDLAVGDTDVVPLSAVGGETLGLVAEAWVVLEDHLLGLIDDAERGRRLDSVFEKSGEDGVYDLLNAFNFLEVQPALDFGCERLAAQLRGKSPGEIREFFNITSEVTADEEEALLREFPWLRALDE